MKFIYLFFEIMIIFLLFIFLYTKEIIIIFENKNLSFFRLYCFADIYIKKI